MTKRKCNYDFIKGVLIILVVWGHCCSYLSGSNYEKNLLTSYIRLFQMPLFIFMSGYFVKSVYKIDELYDRVKKIFYHIGIPYVVWTIIAFTLDLAQNNVEGSLIKSLLSHSTLLWYFGCLIICSILFWMLSLLKAYKKTMGVTAFVLVTAIIMCIPVRFFHIDFLWIFFCIGFLYRRNEAQIKEYINVHLSQAYIGLFLVAIIVLAVGYIYPTSYTFYNMSNNFFQNGIGIYSIFNSLIAIAIRYIIYSLSTLLSFVLLNLLYHVLESRHNIKKWIDVVTVLGRETLVLYAGHIVVLCCIIRTIVQQVTDSLGVLPDHPIIRYYLLCSFIAFITLVHWGQRVLNKNRITAVLFCGNKST